MKVLLIGSGGREHALAWKIAQSPQLKKLYIAPGNAGMASAGECVSIKADDIEALLAFAKQNKIDLTVVGPESPLVKGITDRFQSEGLLVFGPSQKAAQLEGSKKFAKEVMKAAGVPTADFKIFTEVNEAKRYLIDQEPPFVIKADGLAAGKGVVIAKSAEEAIGAVNQMIKDRVFGDAGSKVVIEQFLAGDELSVLVLTDGEIAIPLASSQDHKRVFNNDEGPNTGGMGAYSPCPLIEEEKLPELVKLSAQPVIDYLRNQGIRYQGILYVGLMLTKTGPYVLEYNCRFGDPETQVVLPRLKTDLLPLLYQVAQGKLTTQKLEWDSRASLSVVMASGGYPGNYQTDLEISGLEEAAKVSEAVIFHAGTKLNGAGKICTAGGRVLNVCALGASLETACDHAYKAVKRISFQGVHYRTDIGKRALRKRAPVHK